MQRQFKVVLNVIITMATVCLPVYSEDDGIPMVPDRQNGFELPADTQLPHNSSYVECTCDVLLTVVQQLGWRTIIVVYDTLSDLLLNTFMGKLDHAHSGVILELYRVTDYNENSFQKFLFDVHRRLFPRLDFLLLTSNKTIRNILAYVNAIDSVSTRSTDFSYYSKWLVLLSSGPPDTSVCSLHNLQNVAFVENTCGEKHTAIHSLVHTDQTTSLRRRLYTPSVNESVVYPALNYGFNRRKLLVATLSVSAFIYTETVNNITTYSGFCLDLLNALAKRLNFTYEFVEPKFGTWGVLVNGSWNGLVGMMERREADLALADLSINFNRSKVMDFLLPPIYYDSIDIIYKEESSVPSTWMTFLRPFSTTVFTAISASAAGFFIVYSTAMVLIRNKYTGRNEPTTVKDVFWFTVSSLFKQGTTFINPSTHGIRILMSAWLLFGLVVVAEYTGHLTAAFAVLPEPRLFKNLRQILDHPQYQIGIVKGAITSMLLQNSSNPEYREVWSNIVENRKHDPDIFSESESVHLKKVKGGNYALIDFDSTLRTFMLENCGLLRLGISLEWQPVSLGVPVNSTLKLDLERVMRRLDSSGIFQYWWYVQMSQLKHITCPSRQRSVSSSISLDDIKSGFVLLGAGVGAAAVCLAAEILKKKLMSKKT